MKIDKEENEEIVSNSEKIDNDDTVENAGILEKRDDNQEPTENEIRQTLNNVSGHIQTKEQSEQAEKKEDIQNENKKDKLTKKRSFIFHIIAIICITIFAIAISPKSLQNDTYYTITIGEYIYNNGISNLTEDMYSIHNLAYTYPHWLYDLGLFLVYNQFGHPGIYLSTMILTAILGISVYGLCNKKSKNKVVSLLVTIGSLYVVKGFVAARAQLVTFILFVWAVLTIEKFLETKKFRYALLLILIPLLITNLHCAVFPFYFILFLPYIGEYLLVVLEDADLELNLFKKIFKLKKKFAKKEEDKAAYDRKIARVENDIAERRRKRGIIRQNPYRIKVEKNHVVLLLIAVMGIASLTGFLNPAGNGAYTYLVKTLQGNTTGSINEHLPLTLIENKEFAIAIIIYLLVLIFTDVKIRLSDLFMLGGITFLSFNSRRQVSMFAIFCGPILANLLSYLVAKYDAKTFDKIEKKVTGWFGATVVICLTITGCTNLIKPTLREDYVDEYSYPVEASDWILENLDIENMRLYNEYNYGAYLLHRGIPVFIDSRCDLYTPEFNGTYNKETKEYENGMDIFSDALNIAGLSANYKIKFEEYDITHIILYEDSKLAMVLESDSDYKRIYYEGNFKIFKKLTDEELAIKEVNEAVEIK